MKLQVHGCRCDETTPVNNFLVNWPKKAGICPLNVIYHLNGKASITARTRKTSKPFNKTNIDILNYVQRTRQRIVDVPIIDNGGETSPEQSALTLQFLGPTSASATGSLRHDYGRNERELLHRFLYHKTLGQFQIQVLSIPALVQAKLKSPWPDTSAAELKEEIHKAINTILAKRFELVKLHSRNDWDKYGLDNENCFIVFPIYPPDMGIPRTLKPFNKTNIDILNYVQRTRQRIVDVPIIDNGGETSPVYVRDVWVDYADGIIRRFILSEGAVCIDPPVPRAYPQPRPQDLFDMITDATNENCFIVFPIYPPRYEEIDKLPSS
ncbi:hypothetical protein BLNAU_24569 [Blattamonas nauphoetae]|uniref:Uncharacterized protein n=1 Tax=Blattamonas nauphoetae TaxID=2049346 RepID=A0ABQ9WM12_9EUKA|nr:hypothetical protein BLNAU_24569 [Blattamonas nauphoetae]